MKRAVDIAIISDTHLGTYGCHAKELTNYLKSIQPRTLILNGDIFDMWNFKKSYFPKEHTEVVRRLLKMAVDGTKVYYLTGNHDDVLRRFGELSLGMIQLRNKLVFQVNGRKHWVFHGDVFDSSIQRARWLAKLGGQGYDLLIKINRFINATRKFLGYDPISFAGRVKKSVKTAVKYISDFEDTAIEIAAEQDYDCVICGHIHQPQIREVTCSNGKLVTYMNSGDWVEHLSALEYNDGEWSIFEYNKLDFEVTSPRLQVLEKQQESYGINKEEVVPEMNGMVALEAI